MSDLPTLDAHDLTFSRRFQRSGNGQCKNSSWRGNTGISRSIWCVLFVEFVALAIHCEGVRLEYLPPYSPDLNPIEEAFSKVKSFIRANRELFTPTGLIFDMVVAMEVITSEEAAGYFFHAGYF